MWQVVKFLKAETSILPVIVLPQTKYSFKAENLVPFRSQSRESAYPFLSLLSNFLATGASAFVYDLGRDKALSLNQSNSPPSAVFHHLTSQDWAKERQSKSAWFFLTYAYGESWYFISDLKQHRCFVLDILKGHNNRKVARKPIIYLPTSQMAEIFVSSW